jgi:hypothetical protein
LAGKVPGGAAAREIAMGDAAHGKKTGEGITE